MDFGDHIYYLDCPRPRCHQIYEVREIVGMRSEHDLGKIVCPYCGWLFYKDPEVSYLTITLSQEQQTIVKLAAHGKLGKISLYQRIFCH